MFLNHFIREIKTVHQNGIRFLKADYFSEELYGYRGQVLIKYSLFDLKTIKVFTPTKRRTYILHN